MKFKGFNMFIETIRNIENYKNSIFVIKCSEDVLKNEVYKKSFLENVSLFIHSGIKIVIINDGYKEALNLMHNLGYAAEFEGKYRVFDEKSVEAVEMALSGKINKKLSSQLADFGIKAVGISGRDSRLLKVSKRKTIDNGIEINTGLIGEINGLNKKLLIDLLQAGIVPVISPISSDADGNTYILEANYTAYYISASLKAEKLIIINPERANSNSLFFTRSTSDKNTEEDLDCIRSENFRFKYDINFAAKVVSDSAVEAYIIDCEDIDNMLSQILSCNDKKVLA